MIGIFHAISASAGDRRPARDVAAEHECQNGAVRKNTRVRECYCAKRERHEGHPKLPPFETSPQ